MGTSRQINPLTYYAPYFGYNVHMDQNEKLVDFGYVIVAAVDEASCFVIDFVTMPHKNTATIYSDLYLPMITEFGLFDCLVTDHGREFALAQFVQALLSDRIRENGTASTRPPYKQLRSTEVQNVLPIVCFSKNIPVQNNRVERIWVMVNDRCTYPVKVVVTDLMERGLIDMFDPFTMFSVSYVVRNVVKVLLQRLRDSWNHHSIPSEQRSPASSLLLSETIHFMDIGQ
ncbi:hypothetical protein Y032_0095g2789 [Ancylostoma ceylanicum]|uniref:Integrase core domain-containing protein n=1 Tax=Ancylostoma ceylanicum TaxID=53326 RepID=A0A016TKH4_9BILA|nr:hypothetical protein Y032_0095g2789 [Ancylostoma ceylanicum]